MSKRRRKKTAGEPLFPAMVDRLPFACPIAADEWGKLQLSDVLKKPVCADFFARCIQDIRDSGRSQVYFDVFAMIAHAGRIPEFDESSYDKFLKEARDQRLSESQMRNTLAAVLDVSCPEQLLPTAASTFEFLAFAADFGESYAEQMRWDMSEPIEKIRAMALPVFAIAVNRDFKADKRSTKETKMPAEWKTVENGDEVLIVDGRERARLPAGLGSFPLRCETSDDLKTQIETAVGVEADGETFPGWMISRTSLLGQLGMILCWHWDDWYEDQDDVARGIGLIPALLEGETQRFSRNDWWIFYDALGTYPCRTPALEEIYQLAVLGQGGKLPAKKTKRFIDDEEAFDDESDGEDA